MRHAGCGMGNARSGHRWRGASCRRCRASIPKRLGSRSLPRLPGTFLIFPFIYGIYLQATQTVNAGAARRRYGKPKLINSERAMESARNPQMAALRAATFSPPEKGSVHPGLLDRPELGWAL